MVNIYNNMLYSKQVKIGNFRNPFSSTKFQSLTLVCDKIQFENLEKILTFETQHRKKNKSKNFTFLF